MTGLYDRRWVWLAVLAVAVVALLLGRRFWHPSGAASATVPSSAATPAGTFRPTSQQLKTLTISAVEVHSFVGEERTEGRIAFNGDRITAVFSPLSGHITRVAAAPGQAVELGTVLATIDASEFTQAQNDLRTTQAQLKLARIAETRKHALFDARGGSLADWQQSQADLAAAEAALEASRGRLHILGYTDSGIDALANGSAPAQPAAVIVAPIRGVIVDRQVGPGQYVQAGAGTPVFTVADLSTVWMVANVREAHAARIRVGQTMEVRVLAYPDRSFSGRVAFVGPQIDPSTHRLEVRAVIDNRDGALKPEMFADFLIRTDTESEAPGVPDSAVVYEGESAHVWVVAADNTIVVRPIKVGRNHGGYVEVLEGIHAGERIVTKGSLFIDRAASG